MTFTFAAAVAWDSTGNKPVRNASFQAYAISDTGFTTPLAITDPFNNPIPGNILNSGAQGVFPQFNQATNSAVVITDPAHTYAWTINAVMQDASVAAYIADPTSVTAGQLSATYASAGLPAHAGPRAGRYFPEIGAYNWKTSNTKKFRAGIGRARSGGLCVMSAITDSEGAGWGASTWQQSWPMLVRNALLARGVTAAGEGYVTVSAGDNDTRTSVSGSWASGNNGVRPWTATGATLTHNADLPGTVVKVFYKNTSGTFTVKIDGGAAVTVTPDGTSTLGTYTVSGLSDSKHTIVITTTSAAGALTGIAVERSTGLRINQLAAPGSRASSWTPTGPFDYLYNIANVAHGGVSPDIAFIGLGVNDWSIGKTPVATYKQQMTDLRNSGLLASADVVLVAMAQPTQNNSTVAEWEAYVSGMYDLADALDVPLIDAYAAVFGTDVQARALGVTSGDGVHPNAAGYAAVASLILAAPGMDIPQLQPGLLGRFENVLLDGGGSAAQTFAQSGVDMWKFYQTLGNDTLLLRDILNNRDLIQWMHGASISTAEMRLFARLALQGNITLGQGSSYPGGGTNNLIFLDGTPPANSPAAGGTLFTEGGALRYQHGTTGTINTVGGEVTSVSANYTAANKDSVILATGGAAGITVTLPAATRGARYLIKKTDSGAGAVTVATTSSQTIDGATTKALAAQYASVTVVSDGTAWYVA